MSDIQSSDDAGHGDNGIVAPETQEKPQKTGGPMLALGLAIPRDPRQDVLCATIAEHFAKLGRHAAELEHYMPSTEDVARFKAPIDLSEFAFSQFANGKKLKQLSGMRFDKGRYRKGSYRDITGGQHEFLLEHLDDSRMVLIDSAPDAAQTFKELCRVIDHIQQLAPDGATAFALNRAQEEAAFIRYEVRDLTAADAIALFRCHRITAPLGEPELVFYPETSRESKLTTADARTELTTERFAFFLGEDPTRTQVIEAILPYEQFMAEFEGFTPFLSQMIVAEVDELKKSYLSRRGNGSLERGILCEIFSDDKYSFLEFGLALLEREGVIIFKDDSLEFNISTELIGALDPLGCSFREFLASDLEGTGLLGDVALKRLKEARQLQPLSLMRERCRMLNDAKERTKWVRPIDEMAAAFQFEREFSLKRDNALSRQLTKRRQETRELMQRAESPFVYVTGLIDAYGLCCLPMFVDLLPGGDVYLAAAEPLGETWSELSIADLAKGIHGHLQSTQSVQEEHLRNLHKQAVSSTASDQYMLLRDPVRATISLLENFNVLAKLNLIFDEKRFSLAVSA